MDNENERRNSDRETLKRAIFKEDPKGDKFPGRLL
jgi:hypothetical protein